MRIAFALAALLALPALFSTASAEDKPRASPQATVHQRVHLTDITVKYSSPAAKGRNLFGELVPFDKPWRAGANEATTIEFSKDVQLGDATVKAGTYALFVVPTAKSWTFVLNSEAKQWGAYKHDPAKDVAKVQATVSEVPHRERMTFIFRETKEDVTQLDLEWGKVRGTLAIKVK